MISPVAGHTARSQISSLAQRPIRGSMNVTVSVLVERSSSQHHQPKIDRHRPDDASGIAQQPTGRLGTPNDTANLVRFLLSKQGEWINGTPVQQRRLPV